MLRPELANRLDHPVRQSATQKWVQVLRRLGAHARAQPRCEHHGCESAFAHGKDGWGARIRTWDRGTKTRCLTTWLRPINRCGRLIVRTTVTRAEPARPLDGVASDASALG